jgi:hypothetical protein
MTCMGCGGYWGDAWAGGASNSATWDAMTLVSHFCSKIGSMRHGLENIRHKQGKTTYPLKLGQDIFADTVLVKVTFNRSNHVVYDAAIDTGLIDGKWVLSFVRVKHKWH